MNKQLPNLIALLLAIATVRVNAGENFLKEFDASYDIYNRGVKVAIMHRSFDMNEDGNLIFRSETETSGVIALFRKDKIVEISVSRLIDDDLVPLNYEYRRTGNKKERHVIVTFDWEQNQIRNTVNGSSWIMSSQTGMLDKLLYQYTIMLDLEAGRSRISYLIADGGKEKIYNFELLEKEPVDTPLGTLNTLKLVRNRENSDRQTILWSAPEMAYLPVKVENIETDGSRTIAIINTVSGLSAEDPDTQVRRPAEPPL